MKITVTKKEYEVAKALGFKMVKELSKAEEITGVDEEAVISYEEQFNENFKSTKGKWGKFVVKNDDSIGANKIIIDINEECISDIINELYNPMVIATIKCVINVAKTFKSVFEKCEKSFDKVYCTWFDVDFKTYVMEKYINEDSGKGDFARDLKADKRFPKTNRYYVAHSYLNDVHNCCEDALFTFDLLWEEYNERLDK